MTTQLEESFALQRLYEKWVVKDLWLLNEEAVPLLLGKDPGTGVSGPGYEDLKEKVTLAIAASQLRVSGHAGKGGDSLGVSPATIFQWARTNNVDVPAELANLMEFLLKTIRPSAPAPSPDRETGTMMETSDIEQVLGACFAVVAKYPDECKNRQGVIKPERILRLLDLHAGQLFGSTLPTLSSTAIRDLLRQWLEKLD